MYGVVMLRMPPFLSFKIPEILLEVKEIMDRTMDRGLVLYPGCCPYFLLLLGLCSVLKLIHEYA